MINLGIDVHADSSNSSINQYNYNYVFITNSQAYAAKNNKSCAIINKVELFDDEYLLEVRFEDGSVVQALPEELYEMNNKHTSIYNSSDYLSEFKGNAQEEEDDDFLDDDNELDPDDDDPEEDPEYFDDDEFDDESDLDDDEDTFDTGSGYEDDDDDDL